MNNEKTTGNPLVDRDSDHLDEVGDANLQLFRSFCLLDSIEEEVLEGLKRVLVHVIDNPKLDEKEIEHGSFSSDRTISFSRFIDIFLSLFSEDLLLLNLE